MTLQNFMTQYGKTMGFLETKFLRDVFYADFGELGLDLIEPEVDIDRNDGTGRKWRIDFVIKTKMRKYAIECDGYSYHAAGAIPRERFDELKSKGNEVVAQGFTPISLSRDQIQKNPQESIYEFRRAVNSDPELFNIFLRRTSESAQPNDVQIEALKALSDARENGKKKGLVVLATGLGKTYLSAFDAKASGAKSVLFVVHVEHILKQAFNSFENVFPELFQDKSKVGFFTGNEKDIDGKQVIFSTIQTLTKDKNLSQLGSDQFDYIIMDETHHVAAPSYEKVVDYFNPGFLLGLTATKDRMDGRDILEYFDDNLIYEIGQDEAIKQGYLASMVYKGFKDDIDYSDIYFNGFRYDYDDLNKALMIEKRDNTIIKKYTELANGKRTIGFCVSIEHAEWCANHFRENGIDAVAIHSKIEGQAGQEYQSAHDILEAFTKYKHQVAFVVDMLNEGIDIPDVECLLMLRPTESSTILTQQIGRGLRVAEGKDNLLVLDFIGNYRTSTKILDSLGISPSDLKKSKDNKDIYFYDNNGKRVEFEVEVVDIFKLMLSRSTKKIREDLITDEWQEYGDYLQENTKPGNNLFWSVGKKNDSMEVQLWALDFLKSNNAKYSTNNELSEALQKASAVQFPDKTLEGIRGMFFSKLIGLLETTNPITFSDAYNRLELQSSAKEKYDVVSDQLEKLYFWNDTFSLTNRHEGVGSGRVRRVNEIFHIYPVMFVYDVLIRLYNEGFGTSLSRFEIDTFVIFARENNEADDVAKRIMMFREYDEKYELEKYLKSRMTLDARFYKILQYSKYLSYSPDHIAIRPDKVDSFTELVNEFVSLTNEGELIKFNPKSPSLYRNMLYSNKSLIEYNER